MKKFENKILDGKKLQNHFFMRFQEKIHQINKKINKKPHIHFIKIGNNPSSDLYIKYKEKACQKVGIISSKSEFNDISAEALLSLIQEYNSNNNINGILTQLPLPSTLDENQFIEAILPIKDVDGFHPYNTGKLWRDASPYFIPCTPYGIYHLLKEYSIQTQGKHIVIINRSNIVGKPMAALLLYQDIYANATVTVCHRYTANLIDFIQQADILITAMGQPLFIKDHMIKNNAVIIDVASTAYIDSEGKRKFAGDVDIESVIEKCSYITPNPGGVGPMTITMLLHNTIKAFEIQHNLL